MGPVNAQPITMAMAAKKVKGEPMTAAARAAKLENQSRMPLYLVASWCVNFMPAGSRGGTECDGCAIPLEDAGRTTGVAVGYLSARKTFPSFITKRTSFS